MKRRVLLDTGPLIAFLKQFFLANMRKVGLTGVSNK